MALTVVALSISREYSEIIAIFLGAILGAFVLDFEYVLNAYFIETNSHFSQTLKGYIKHRDFKNAINFINLHKNEVKEKTLNSALFQIILGLLLVWVTYSSDQPFVKSLLLVTYATSIYKFAENYFEGNLKDWFWAININVNKNTIYWYSAALITVLALALFRI